MVVLRSAVDMRSVVGCMKGGDGSMSMGESWSGKAISRSWSSSEKSSESVSYSVSSDMGSEGGSRSSSQRTQMRPLYRGGRTTRPDVSRVIAAGWEADEAKNMHWASLSPSRPWRKGNKTESGGWVVMCSRCIRANW